MTIQNTGQLSVSVLAFDGSGQVTFAPFGTTELDALKLLIGEELIWTDTNKVDDETGAYLLGFTSSDDSDPPLTAQFIEV